MAIKLTHTITDCGTRAVWLHDGDTTYSVSGELNKNPYHYIIPIGDLSLKAFFLSRYIHNEKHRTRQLAIAKLFGVEESDIAIIDLKRMARRGIFSI